MHTYQLLGQKQFQDIRHVSARPGLNCEQVSQICIYSLSVYIYQKKNVSFSYSASIRMYVHKPHYYE